MLFMVLHEDLLWSNAHCYVLLEWSFSYDGSYAIAERHKKSFH